MPGETCSYTHDVSDSDRFPDLDQQWHCDRPAVGETEACIFHLHQSHESKTAERLKRALRGLFTEEQAIEEGGSNRRIIGAKLPGLQLPYQNLEGHRRRPVDLRESSVTGTVDCTAARLGPALRLEGCRIEGDVIFRKAVAEGDLLLDDAEIEGRLDARRADLRGVLGLDNVQCEGRCILLLARVRHGVRLRKAKFRGGVWHGLETGGDIECGKARFDGPLNAERADVDGDLSFNNAVFEHSLRLAGATVNGATSINDTRVRGAVSFMEAELHGDLDIRATTFGRKVDLREATVVDASLSRAQFSDAFRADRATFRSLTIDATRFQDSASLSDVTVTADASFSEPAIRGVFHLDRATFEGEIRMRGIRAPDASAVVDCTEADIGSGVIDTRNSGGLMFDFTRATLGDVRFRPEQSGADGTTTGDGRTPFESCRFLRTTFEGFDFTDYDAALGAVNWRLHPDPTDTVGRHGIADPTVGDYEKTYTKAKQGASDEGASRAAGAFLVRELTFRRKGHAVQWRNATPPSLTWIQGMYRWIANWLLRLTAGYGERLAPVLGTTTVILSLFAIAYALLLPTPPYDVGAAGYGLLSLTAFVTLVFGQVSVGGGIWVQVLTRLEGFLGAFLIALFVFVFTRSVHR